jgi:hypothetical protein
MVSREAIFLVFFFLSQFLSGHPPARDFLNVRGVGHVHDHERVTVGALVIFQAQRLVPAAIEVGVFSAIVEIVMSAVAFLSRVVFLQKIGLGGIGDIVVADSAEPFEGQNLVTQFLVILSVRKFGDGSGQRLRRGAHHDPLFQLGVVDHGAVTLHHSLIQDHWILGLADVNETSACRE